MQPWSDRLITQATKPQYLNSASKGPLAFLQKCNGFSNVAGDIKVLSATNRRFTVTVLSLLMHAPKKTEPGDRLQPTGEVTMSMKDGSVTVIAPFRGKNGA